MAGATVDKKIKDAWRKWESIEVPEYHSENCGYLYGSRPEWCDCDCGLRAAMRSKEDAFRELRALVMGTK